MTTKDSASVDNEAASAPPAATTPALTPRAVRRIALHAQLCEATVLRYLSGKPVRPSSRERIERALSAKRNKPGAS
jgi:hypothetical protein